MSDPLSAPSNEEVLEALDALVSLVEVDCCGPATDDDPDDASVGWSDDGELPMTFGHIRRARAAVEALKSQGAEGSLREALPEGCCGYTDANGECCAPIPQPFKTAAEYAASRTQTDVVEGREPVAWQVRFYIGGCWGSWHEPEPNKGTREQWKERARVKADVAFRDLYTSPPSIAGEDAVETVAKAIFAADCSGIFTWDEGTEDFRQLCRVHARAALRALPSNPVQNREEGR